MTRFATVTHLIILICSVALTDGGWWKILGGHFKNYDITSQNVAGNTREWGSQDTGAGTSILTLVDCYCWNPILNQRGYCYQKLIVSDSDDYEGSHFQIEGSYQVIYDSDRSVILDTIHHYGRRYAEPPMQDVVVAEGETWNPTAREWSAYGYLHFIVNSTTRPSFTNAFSHQKHSSADPQMTKEEYYIGQLFHSSIRTNIAHFRSWDEVWRSDTLKYFYRWIFSVVMVDAVPQFKDAQAVTFRHIPGRSFVLENLDLSPSSITFPEVSSSQFSFTSSAYLSSTFGFSYTVSQPIWFEIPSLNVSELATSLSFTFSNASELESLITESVSLSTKWPSTCPAATRVIYRIYIIEEFQRLPVDFVFQTGQAKWIERKDIVATLKGTKVSSKSCCLSEAYRGHETCQFPKCI